MEDPIAPAAAGAPSKPVFITEAPAAGAPAIPQADDFSKDEIVEMTAGAREEPSETMRLMDKRKRQQEAQRSLEEERKKIRGENGSPGEEVGSLVAKDQGMREEHEGVQRDH